MTETDDPQYYSCELCAWKALEPCSDHAGRAVWFALSLADGREVVGTIQGSGGLVGAGISQHVADRRGVALERVRRAIDRADLGYATGLVEPDKGCAIMFPEYSAAGNGLEQVVDLRGAKARLAEEPGR